jgi:hypothetical protein
MDRRLIFALLAVIVVALLAALALTREDIRPAEPIVHAPLPSPDPSVNADAAPKPSSRKRAPAAVTGQPAERGQASTATVPSVTPPSSPSLGTEDQTDHRLDAGVLYPLTPDGFRQAIRARRDDVRDCYDGWLEQNPALSGTMVVALEISTTDGGTGGITHLEVLDGGMGHMLMEGCVLNALSDLRFERPASPVTLHYPFFFLNENADGGGQE